MDLEPELPTTQGDTTAVSCSLKFIDELERQRDRDSHLRTVVRATARKVSHSKRRSLNAVNIPPAHSNSPRKLEKAIRTSWKIDAFSSSSGSGSLTPSEYLSSMTTCEDDNRAHLDTSESTRYTHNVAIDLPQSRILRHLDPCLDENSRQDQNDYREFIDTHIYQYSKSQEDFDSQQKNDTERQYNLHQRQLSPRSLLDAWRTDLSNSYPIDSNEIQPYMHSLVDYHAFICASGMPRDPNTGNYIHTKWLKLCMENVMVFKSMLLAAETCIRGHRGLGPWSFRAILLNTDCIRMLNEELSKSEPGIPDNIFATVINLAATELLWGDRTTYRGHLKGLKAMVNQRGGLDRLPRHLRIILLWIDQIGADMILFTTDSETSSTIFQDKEAVAALQITSQGSALKPSRLIRILKSIRFLTTNSVTWNPTSVILSDDFRATCFTVQLQLEQLLSIPASPCLEASCVLAAVIYIDLILLDTPVIEVIKSHFTRQLHEMMISVRSAGDVKENGDIVTWISAMALAIFGDRGNQKVVILEKFQVALAALEARSVSASVMERRSSRGGVSSSIN